MDFLPSRLWDWNQQPVVYWPNTLNHLGSAMVISMQIRRIIYYRLLVSGHTEQEVHHPVGGDTQESNTMPPVTIL